jgi:hypothetical protein
MKLNFLASNATREENGLLQTPSAEIPNHPPNLICEVYLFASIADFSIRKDKFWLNLTISVQNPLWGYPVLDCESSTSRLFLPAHPCLLQY